MLLKQFTAPKKAHRVEIAGFAPKSGGMQYRETLTRQSQSPLEENKSERRSESSARMISRTSMLGVPLGSLGALRKRERARI
jgi:hypothetical protein